MKKRENDQSLTMTKVRYIDHWQCHSDFIGSTITREQRCRRNATSSKRRKYNVVTIIGQFCPQCLASASEERTRECEQTWVADIDGHPSEIVHLQDHSPRWNSTDVQPQRRLEAKDAIECWSHPRTLSTVLLHRRSNAFELQHRLDTKTMSDGGSRRFSRTGKISEQINLVPFEEL